MSEEPRDSGHIPASIEEERWALVQRIAASRQLAKAPQLREILFYTARKALAEDATVISEQEIGCRVLGRRPDFSPNEDNIVRVQVRHLRRKLEEYFNNDGAAEPILLTIPKGGYLPRFETRIPQPSPQTADAAPTAGVVPAIEGSPGREWATGTRWTVMLVSAFLAALAFTGLFLWKQQASVRQNAAAGADQAPDQAPPWSKVFSPRQQTDIVVSDSSLVAVQDILNVDIALDDYLSGSYPEKLIETVADRQLRTALRLISARQYTSLSDANIASKMMDLSRRYSAPTNICYSRFVSVREFKTGNFILIGSRRGIPWVQLFEPEMNFSLEADHATGKYFFLNRAPRPGEKGSYRLSFGRDAETYADIALLPNLTGTGYVLLLAGIDMAGTEAAGELVTSPGFPKLLNKLLRSGRRKTPAPYFELLVRGEAVAGTAQTTKVIAYRLLTGPSAAPVTGRTETTASR